MKLIKIVRFSKLKMKISFRMWNNWILIFHNFCFSPVTCIELILVNDAKFSKVINDSKDINLYESMLKC